MIETSDVDPMAEFSRTRDALITAYDLDLTENATPGLASALGLAVSDTAVATQIQTRRDAFVQALDDLTPVFEKVAAAKNAGLLSQSRNETISIELENQSFVIRPYDPSNAIQVKNLEALPIEVFPQASLGTEGQFRSGAVFLSEDLGKERRAQVLNHEARGHAVMEAARRETPQAVAQLLNTLNSTDSIVREQIKQLFYKSRIMAGNARPLTDAVQVTVAINTSRLVMPENPEVWAGAVRDTARGPMFSAYFLDETMALFMGMLAQIEDAEMAGIQTSADWQLDSKVTSSAEIQFFEILKDTVGADVSLLRQIGFLEPLNEILKRDVAGAFACNYCYEIVRRKQYTSVFTNLNLPEGELLAKLFGTDEGVEATGDIKKDGVIKFYGEEFISGLIDSFSLYSLGPSKKHKMGEIIEGVALEYFEQAINADDMTEDEFINLVLARLAAELGAEFSLEELMELLRSNPGLFDSLRKLFGELKDARKYMDGKHGSKWREELLKEIGRSTEGGGHHPVEPVRRKQIEQPPQPMVIPDSPAPSAPQREIPGARSEVRNNKLEVGSLKFEDIFRRTLLVGPSGVSTYFLSSTFQRPLSTSFSRSEVRVDNTGQGQSAPEEETDPWKQLEENKNWQRLKEDAVRRLYEANPDILTSELDSEKVFRSWFGDKNGGSEPLFDGVFETNLTERPGGGFFRGSDLTPGEIELVLSFLDFMNPDVEKYAEATGRFIPEGSPVQKGVRSSVKRQKRVFTIYGEPGVGKSHLMKGFAKHILSPEFADGERAPWMVFRFNKMKFYQTHAALMAQRPGSGNEKIFSLMNQAMRRFMERPNVLVMIDEAHELARVKTGTVNNFYNEMKPELADSKKNSRIWQFTTRYEYAKYLKGNEESADQRRREEAELEELSTLYVRKILQNEMHHWDIDGEYGADASGTNPLERNGIRFSRGEGGEPAIADELIALKQKFAPEWAAPAKELGWFSSLAAKQIAFIEDLRVRLKLEPEHLAKMVNFYLEDRRRARKQGLSEAQQRALRADQDQDTLIDRLRAAAYVLIHANKLIEDKKITAEDLYRSVSEDEDLPLSMVSYQDLADPAEVRARLKARVIGQDEAVDMIVDAYTQYYQRKKDDPDFKEPFKIFLAGPSRTGKTYFGDVWADVVVGNKDAVDTIAMAAFSAPHTVAKMQGSPAGYVDSDEPGLFTKIMRKRKSVTVVKFDEVEKAHPAIFDYILPALRPGVLEDMQGNQTVWRNVTAMFTSNLGMTDPESDRDKSNRAQIEKIYETLKKGDEDQLAYALNSALMKIVDGAVRDFMRPEFMNRMTVKQPVFFKWLHPDAARELVDGVWLKDLIKEYSQRGVEIQFDQTFKTHLKTGGLVQFQHDETAEEVTDAVRDHEGKLYLLDAKNRKLVVAKSDTEKTTLALDIPDAQKIFLVNTPEGVQVVVARESGGAVLAFRVPSQPLSAVEGARVLDIDSSGRILYVRDGKLGLTSLQADSEPLALQLPAGFQLSEAVLIGDEVLLTNGKNIYGLKISAPAEAPRKFLETDETGGIRDLKVDGAGHVVYLTDRDATHTEIDTKKGDQTIDEELREVARAHYSMMSGSEDFMEKPVKNEDGTKEIQLYRREGVFVTDDQGRVQMVGDKPVYSKAFEAYLQLEDEARQLQQRIEQLEEVGIVKGQASGDEYDKISKQLSELGKQIGEKYQIRGRIGLAGVSTDMAERFYVRAGKEFEEVYHQWEKDRAKVMEKNNQGVSSKEVKQKSTFLMMLAADGSLIQAKDLFFRKAVLYEDADKAAKRRDAEKKFGELPEKIRLQRSESGDIQILDTNRRTSNTVTAFQYSGLAEFLVETFYDNAFEGIAKLQKAFRDLVR
ncbi:MAG: AAA family ATPase, partial [Candidatus Omnitrophica bacterium]|nr:AAA family ATPase [Candidatus Omnitrophota bacterium]